VIEAVDGTRGGGRVERIWAGFVRRHARGRNAGPRSGLRSCLVRRVPAERLRAVIELLPPGLTEICTSRDRSLSGGRAGYRYSDELLALLDGVAKRTLSSNGIPTGRFADFM
jgi:hypothetical protein